MKSINDPAEHIRKYIFHNIKNWIPCEVAGYIYSKYKQVPPETDGDWIKVCVRGLDFKYDYFLIDIQKQSYKYPCILI